jgi:hypothetical protein
MNRILTIALLVATLIGGMAASPQRVAAASPVSLNLFMAAGFRYQDPNYFACTATSTMDVLNFIALSGRGGVGFRWKANLTDATRDAILAWERTHDTLAGGSGSDPHGIRNALNFYGWGSQALWAGYRVYDDIAFNTFDGAVKRAVRAMIQMRKPVVLLAWAGQHAQMMVGYYGLVGDPFAKDSLGRYTNAFSVVGFYLADPLKSQAFVNKPISYSTLRTSTNAKMRFRPYLETDSPYDDPYTGGVLPARNEWYNRFVIVAPLR